MEKIDKINKKYCKFCGQEIPTVKFDTFGRRNTRTSDFCNKNHASSYFRLTHPDYYKTYYKNNKDKYGKQNRK